MGFIVFTPEIKARLAELKDHARQRQNWFRPARDLEVPAEQIPGNNPAFVAMVGTYRAVFTWSVDPDSEKVLRHLSVSAAGAPAGKYPNPYAALTIATLLGFTGGVVDERRAVTIAPCIDWMVECATQDGQPVVILGQWVTAAEILEALPS